MVVVQTDVLGVTVLIGRAGVVGSAGGTSDTLVVGAVVSRGAVVVDRAGGCTGHNADVVGADISGGTVAIDGTSECLAATSVVGTHVAGRTLGIMIARIRLLTDCVLRVTYESSTAV